MCAYVVTRFEYFVALVFLDVTVPQQIKNRAWMLGNLMSRDLYPK